MSAEPVASPSAPLAAAAVAASPSSAPTPDPPTASDLLAVELLSKLLTLVRPSSRVATTCTQVRSLVDSDRCIRFSWRNSVLLGTIDSVTDVGQRYRHQIVAILMSLLPRSPGYSEPATGIAPTCPPTADPVFSSDYLDYLYTRVLLLRLPNSVPNLTIPARGSSKDALSAMDDALAATPSTYTWWHPITDALLLPVYLLRAGQLDLFERAIQHLLSSMHLTPVMQAKLAWPSWSVLCLDNRQPLKQFLAAFDDEYVYEEPVTYPLLLATFALLEWSLPALERLVRLFPTLLSHTMIADHALDLPTPFFHLMCATLTVGHFDNMDRVIALYKWLGWRDLMYGWFPLIRCLPDSARIEDVWRVLVEIDIPAFQAQADPEHLDQLKMALMAAIIHLQHHDFNLVALVLDQAQIGRADWARVIPWDLETLWTLVQTHIEPVNEQRAIAVEALCCALSMMESHQGAQADIKSTVIRLAHILTDDFGMDLIDLVLSEEDQITYQQANLLFLALSGSLTLPNPLPTLSRLLPLFETSATSDSASIRRLCAMTAVFFHLHMANHASLASLPAMSMSQLATLAVAVLVGTALADAGVWFPLSDQMSAVESLLSHAQVAVDSPSFFDFVPQRLCMTVLGMAQELVVTAHEPPEDDGPLDKYTRDPKLARWVVERVAQLDAAYVGEMGDQQA